jgi:hypothetical protein
MFRGKLNPKNFIFFIKKIFLVFMIVWGAFGGFSGIFPFTALDIQKAKAATFSMQSGYYIGSGAIKSITGLGFTPNLVMIKADDASGVGMVVKSSAMPASHTQLFAGTSANDTGTLITLDADGFTLSSGANVNTSGVKWNWVAFGGSDCTASGTFCVGTYSGTGAAQSINTGFQPDLVVTRDASTVAAIWKSSSMGANENNYFHAAAADTGGQMIKTLDASGFTVGTGNNANQSGHTFYFFAFKQVAGAMDVGTFTGTGVNKTISSSDDAGLTFQSDFTFMKNSTNAAAAGVATYDRGNFSVAFTDAAAGGNYFREQTSTGGFKVGTFSSVNGSGAPMYYASFGGAAAPSTSGTYRYASGTYTGTGSALSVTGLGFRPDLVIVKGAAAQYAFFRTSLVPGDKSFYLGYNSAGLAAFITSIDSDGFSIGTNGNANTNGVVYYWEAFGNAWNPETNTGAKDFTIGAYTGNGVDSRDIYRLPFTPDLVVVKDSPASSITSWRTSAMSGDLTNAFHAAAAQANMIQSLGDHSFQVGIAVQPYEVNTTNELCYFFAFATSSYFSVGTYTGTGLAHDITGVGNDPDLVWVKKRSGGTARAGMFLANNLTDGNAQYFVSTANAASKITALGTNLFTVGTGNETNESTYTYDYAAWESPPTTTPAVSIDASSGTTDVSEAGATDTYTVVLNYRPTSEVVVALSSDAQTTLSTSSIVFTTSNWSTAQTITVSAVNDIIAEGSHTSTITHSASSTDNTFNGISISSETVNITDNDTAGFTVSAISGSTNEAGATATFTVVLTSQPTSTVTTTIHSSNTAEGTINTSTLVFSADSWNLPRTVTVTGVDDSIDDGDIVYSIILDTATSSDSNYDGVNPNNVSVTNTDNDTAGVTVTESAGTTNITEAGATDSYTMVLNSQPTDSVFVNIASDAQSTLSTSSIIFTTTNWNTPQTITVTAVNDSVVEGGHTSTLTHSATSTDGTYNTIPISNVVASVTDNDTAGFTVSAISGNTSEAGATATFTVVLESQPSGTVTTTIHSSDTSEGTINTSTLIFDATSWNLPRTVTVTGVDDAVDDGDIVYSIILDTVTSSDSNYNGINPSDVSVTNTDNDTAGVTIVESGDLTDITEGGATDSYTTVLNTQPVGDVSIHIGTDGESTLSTSSITFQTSNWNVARTITVTAVDDGLDEGIHTSTITHSATSTDGVYDGIAIDDVVATIIDNDFGGGGIPGITVSLITGDTLEIGTQETFTVVLDAEPSGFVTTTIHSSDTSEGTIDTTVLVFDSVNWNIPQTVTVTGVNDDIADGDMNFTIILDAAVSGDGNYNGMDPVDVDVINRDDDIAGINMTESGGGTNVTEGDADDTYEIVLTSEPTANVTITITPDEFVSVSTSSIVFNPSNWNIPRTISVTAIDDNIAEGLQFSTITNVATSADGNYDGFFINSVFPNVTDNDTADVILTDADVLDVTEGAGTDSYTIELGSEPLHNVVIDLTPNAQLSLSTTSITIVPARWNIPVTVTVSAVDDAIDDDAENGSITTNVTSDDVNYLGFFVGDLSPTVHDNDEAGISIEESGGTTDATEGGATDTYTVVLHSEPTNQVTVDLTPDDIQVSVSSSSLYFDSTNWSVPQTITVTAVNDVIAEAPLISSITHNVTSADFLYDNMALANVDVNVTDNDIAGFTISLISGDTTEAGGTATFTVVLNTEPTEIVTTSIQSLDTSEGTINTSTLVFSPADWNLERTVTVTGVDDAVVDGDIDYVIALDPAVSDDLNYNGVMPGVVDVTNLDNDTAGFDVSAISGDTSEAGTTSTFTVVLTSEPSGIVTTTVHVLDATEHSINTSTLVFSPEDWNLTRTVIVTGVDDDIDDGNQPNSVILDIATSTDPNYDGMNPDDVNMLVNLDNDSAGVTLVESDGTTDVTEGGATDTYTVVLNTQPTGNVAIHLNTDGESILSTSSITFQTSNWNVARTITVTAVDDAVQQGEHSSTITHTVTSTDEGYEGIAVGDVVATVTDNDTAGFTVSAISGNTSEAGATATFTVVLNSEPSGVVTTTIHSSDTTEGTITTSTLVFHSNDWNIPRTVTVTGVDDFVSDGDIAYTIILDTATSTVDVNYAGINPNDVNVTNTDNDTIGVTVTESAGTTDITEGGATDSYTIVLNTQPTGNVAISVSADAHATVSTSSIVFTPANWDTAQTITVTAVNDAAVEGAHTSTLTHSATSTDGAYDGIMIGSVTANITDNDTAGFTVSLISASTTEAGGTATFTVVLNSQPTGIVTTTVHSSDITEGTITTSTLVFSPGSWNLARTVTVTGVDDILADGNINYSIILDTATSTDDVNYAGINPSDVAVTNIDNDVVGITLVESGGTTGITEGGATDSYTIVLNSQPTGDVAVSLSADVDSTISTSSIVFTPINWNVAQTLTITAVDDIFDEGAHFSTITHSVTSTDPGYDGIAIVDVVANVIDNDTAGFTVSLISASTTEAGGTATFTVVLSTPPTGIVTTTVHSSDTTEGTINTSTLVFSPADWDFVRTVTVTGVDDALVDGNINYSIILDTATSTDMNYDGLDPDDVSVTNIDNDTGGVTVTESAGTTDIAEGGATDSYTIVLNSQPTGNVAVSIVPDAQSTVSTSSIVFTALNWNNAQTITVTAVNDALAEGDHTSTITHTATSTDLGYDGIAIDSVTANITDNDAAGFTVSLISGDTTEAGGTATFTVVLDSPPSGLVTTTVHSSDTTEGTVNTSTLVFDALSWNLPRTVTVSGVDDELVDGNIAYSIILDTASSTDIHYAGLNPADVSVTNTDNDTVGITLVESAGTTDITEGGAGDSYTLVLNSEPTGDVSINITSDAQSIVSTSSIIFTTSTWNIAKTITVTAVNDHLAEGGHTSVITHTVTSTDLSYDALAIPDVIANVTDNDNVGITLTESAGATDITEGAATDSYTLVLTSEPSSTVGITLTSDAQSTLSTSSITFTSSTWNIAQTITVTAVDDSLSEGAHVSTITHLIASDDVNYNAVIIPDLTADITDNDSTSVVLTESGGTTNITEAGVTDSYTIMLSSEPLSSVFVSIVSDAQSTLSTSSIQFTTSTWNIAQTITVTAINDLVAEGAHDSTLTHTVTSTDPGYDAIVVPDITAHITDNDTAGVTLAQSAGTTNIAEGGATDSYTLVLNSKPSSDVAITLTPDAESTLSTTSISFSSTTWNIPVSVTITAEDDADVEGPHTSVMSHSADSLDAAYNAIVIADLTANVIDNDTPGVTVTESLGTTDITEGGIEDSYTIVLNALPVADVTIEITPDAASTVSTSSLVFNVANWNIPRIVTTTAVDDAVSQGLHISTISHAVSSLDINYDLIATSDVVVNVTDNDTAGITVSAISGNTSESGATSTYTVVLDSEPRDDVFISVSSSDASEATVDQALLTFTALNWNIPQTITVTGVDDLIADGLINYSLINGVASSTDDNYDGRNPADVDALNTDNDVAGIGLTQSGGATNITEGGATDSYTLVLDTEPVNDVTITITPDAQSTVSTSSIVFTSTNWNVAQTITVSAFNDDSVEDPHDSTITASASSLDANYNGLAIVDVTAHITDNDIAGFTVSLISGDTSEAGTTATFTLVLNSEPSSPVTTTLSSSDLTEGTVNSSTLVFGPADWNIPRTVTVSGVDDYFDDGDIDFSIVLDAAVSGDAHYNALNPDDVSVTNIDDDGVGINVVESAASTDISEAGSSDSYTLVLGSTPTADVVVTLASDAQSTLSTTSITFTPDRWNIPVEVTVTAVDDAVDEGAHTSTLTATALSADISYNGIAIADITAHITDNDAVSDPIKVGGGGGAMTIPSVPLVPLLSNNGESDISIVFTTKDTEVLNFPSSSHRVIRVSASADEAVLVIESGPIVVHLKKDIAQILDTDKNGIPDLRVVYDGLLGKNPKFTFTEIQELLPVFINNGAKQTFSRMVHMQFNIVNASFVAISNNPDFSDATFQTFTTSSVWALPFGDGTKTVYVRFRSKSGGVFDTSASINLVHSMTPCTLSIGRSYKSLESNAVYYITPPYSKDGQPIEGSCTKRAFKASPIFFSYFASWSDVQVVPKADLANIADDALGFMPRGPRYAPQNGTLMKVVSDPNVYLLINGKKHVIASEEIFKSLGFEWNYVEDVAQELLDMFAEGDVISKNEAPALSVIGYADSPRLYFLEPSVADSSILLKRYIASESAWKSLNYRTDRIIRLPASSIYGDGTQIGEESSLLPNRQTLSSGFTFTHSLVLNDSGSEVEALQKILASQGFFNHEITGLYGPVTVEAVKAFQRAHGLEDLGIVGPGTRSVLNSL